MTDKEILNKTLGLVEVLKSLSNDNRIPLNIREEYMDKVNSILEAEQ
jgi:uncharacterized protein (UPF0147 family)